MNKIFSTLLAGVFALTGTGQNANAQTDYNSGIGIHFGANDFYGPQTNNYWRSDVRSTAYNATNARYDTSTKNKFLWTPLVRLTFWRHAGPHFDVNIAVSLGNVDYPTNSNDTGFQARARVADKRQQQLFLDADVRFNYSIFSRGRYFINPYLFAGISGDYRPNYYGASMPLGAGLNFNLSRQHDVYLNVESAYKIAASDHEQNHLQHSVGLVYWFKRHHRKIKSAMAPEATPKVVDSDNDGIPDDQDQCPTIAGPAQFNGCPDTDGDGIPDNLDACPLVAGLAQFNGCPDSDGDGIPDNKDKCPYVAGPPERDGCPVPDRDGDGFPDDVDKCPDVYSKTNGGCPEIRKEVIMEVEKAAKAIFFETGKASIKKISFKSLDAVVNILKSDPSLNADIEGHTDNVKPKTYTNMELSQKRAEAVKEYFVSKGVDAGRLSAQGFGDTQPVADNATAAGKAQNRRTVIKLRNFAK